MNNELASIASAEGLTANDRDLVNELVKVWDKHRRKNRLRHTYYIMHNRFKDLEISIPPHLKNLPVACSWGAKVVDVMVDHLKFDGYTSSDAEIQSLLESISRRVQFPSLYEMATTSALEQCFALLAVFADDSGKPCVAAYPASVCGCKWDRLHNRLESAMFVVDSKRDSAGNSKPTWVNVVTDTYVIRIRRNDTRGGWKAEYVPHGLEHLPVFILRHKPSLMRPFGESRITRDIMWYIDCAVRANVNEEVAAAFAASTQKYLLGTNGDPFEDVSAWQAYIGSIFNIDATDDGDVPQFGQLPQPSMQPLSDRWRLLCGKMSAASGIHVSQFGLVHDQPASGDAIYLENEPLMLKCKSWNNQARNVLVDVAIALLATERGTTFDEIDAQGYNIAANLMNPASPTLAQQTDSSVKIASAVDGFAQTRQFWLMNGFSVDEADRTMAEVEAVQTKQAANAVITGIFGETTDASTS